VPADEPRSAIEGSARAPIPDARDIGPVAPDERIEVTIRVRPQTVAGLGAAGIGALLQRRAAHEPAARSGYLTRAELRTAGGADPGELGLVEAFAREHGLAVLESDPAERRVVVAGAAARLAAAFGVTLRRYELAGLSYRGRTGEITIPARLASTIEGVFGLDDRPQARPHFRLYEPEPAGSSGAGAFRPAIEVERSFTPAQVAHLYDFVADADGSGETIALIELGGGLRPADISAYFDGLGSPLPAVTIVSVDGGRNEPTTADSADGEVMLDIEVAGSVAPGARIVVYFAPNTDRGFLDAISRAVHDTLNRPSVISISWGGPESAWTGQAMRAMDQAFAEAALVGVTVTCASGDNGSDDRVGDGRAHADFPASSPHVLACGGTRINGSIVAISAERTWNDGAQGGASGGGISDVFEPPPYQADAGLPKSANPGGRAGRGVPDVAGDASPASGYAVRVDGRDMVIGGTSAVAPLYAGLVAQLNQKLGRPVGFLNPALYGAGRAAIRDITAGDNGAYRAGPGWDACTGLGRIDGAALLAILAKAAQG
jgi:kumamolisin